MVERGSAVTGSNSLITLIVGLLAGAIGWWITNFFLRPVQRIEELRQRAHEELIFYANIGKGSPDVDRDTARLALRRVAAGLMASAESASRVIRWWIGRQGWNLPEAGKHLLATANTLDQEVQPNLKI
jgi:hypothetical protein